MYAKYHTDALVLSSREMGESDKVLTLYTRDFGLLYARAAALRSERSRMRSALSDLSAARVSLVRGARGWRLAGATSLRTFVRGSADASRAWARIVQLLGRLIKGEEKNIYLFSALMEAHAALSAKECEAWDTIELVCVARVLYALGYLSRDALGVAFFAHTSYAAPELKEAENTRELLLSSVNEALSETHL